MTERTLSKLQLIDSILDFNNTASPDFLSLFPEVELEKYLSRVSAVAPRRTRAWQRPRWRFAPADLVTTVVHTQVPAVTRAIAPVPAPEPEPEPELADTHPPIRLRRPDRAEERPVEQAINFLRSRRWPIPAASLGLSS